MVPLSEVPSVDLAGKRILLLSGAVDPIVRPENSRRLAAIFREAKADMQAHTLPVGHGLTPQDVSLTQNWFTNGSL
jgi:phospholipase/carboxylesterase